MGNGKKKGDKHYLLTSRSKLFLMRWLRSLGSLLKNSIVLYLRTVIIRRLLSTEVLQMETLWCGSLKQLVFTSRDSPDEHCPEERVKLCF